MKIVKNIVGALLRAALVLTPGAVFLWWLWGKVAALPWPSWLLSVWRCSGLS